MLTFVFIFLVFKNIPMWMHIKGNEMAIWQYGNNDTIMASINGPLNCEIMTERTMVLILEGNPEIGAHVRSNLCYFLC